MLRGEATNTKFMVFVLHDQVLNPRFTILYLLYHRILLCGRLHTGTWNIKYLLANWTFSLWYVKSGGQFHWWIKPEYTSPWEATNTKFMVFGLTRLGFESMISRCLVLWLCCVTPLSTIFQLYRGSQIYL